MFFLQNFSWRKKIVIKMFSIQTNLPVFRVKESSVRRRFSDFEWLRNELERDSKIVVPALPSKAIKRQLPFRGDDGDLSHPEVSSLTSVTNCRNIRGRLHRGTTGRPGGFYQQDSWTPTCTERTLPSHVSTGLFSIQLSPLQQHYSTGGEYRQDLCARKDPKHLKRLDLKQLETCFCFQYFYLWKSNQ